MKPKIDLDELVELVELPDTLFQWHLDTETGEVVPGGDDSGHLHELPVLHESQILDWMASFSSHAKDLRIQGLLEAALKYPAPKVRFREVLSVNPQALREWNDYFNQKRRTLLLEWLRSLGLEQSSDTH